MFRYGSEPGLDDPNFMLMGGGAASPAGSRQNLTELAQRFPASDDNLFRSLGEGDGQVWSLTVNFGKKYTTLQQLLEWLEMWGNKSHAVGGLEDGDMLEISVSIPSHDGNCNKTLFTVPMTGILLLKDSRIGSKHCSK